MTDFLDVEQVDIPLSAALQTHEFLRKAGTLGCEGFAVWVGRRTRPHTFSVIQTVIPDQRPIRTESGIMVVIGPKELHALNVWLYENELSLIAQIHSHPTEAYHSDTDDHLAIATVIGSFSFVVPDFAVAPFALNLWAPYRLSREGKWTELTSAEVQQLIRLER